MGSRVFDGIDDFLQAATAVVQATPFTFACWFKPANVTANHTLVGVSDIDVDTRYHNLRAAGATAGDPVQAISRNSTSGVSASASGFTADAWHHVAGVFASTTSRLVYVNGAAGTANTTLLDPPAMDTTYVGRLSRVTPADFAAGKIAVIAVWSVALSAGEIATLAGGALPTAVQPASLIAYWPMMSGASPEPDDVGLLDLTVNGTTFDAADTPPVGETPMPSTDATFVDVTGAVTNIFTAAVANTVVTVRVSAPVLLAGDDALARFPLRPEDGPLQLTLGIGTDLMAGASAQPGQPTEARVFIFVTEP